MPQQSYVETLEQVGVFNLPLNIDVGQQMYDLVRDLNPICRSITGDGVRTTLAAIGDRIPLDIHEVPSGTQVLDWTVPEEWNIRDAYVQNRRGERVIDFQRCPLHVLGYSVPVRGRFPLSQLKSHLYTDPEHPEWVPFRYSYYNKNWGFCLAHRDLEQLKDEEYDVVIDSTLEPGSLTYAECFLPGKVDDEVLISVHTCHPWMCNDNLSGIAVATALAQRLSRRRHRLSYRFVFIPTTIGSITWLSRNERDIDRIKHGLVLTCVGDSGGFNYKRSRAGDADIDRAMHYALKQRGEKHTILEFIPFGFDERQYSSPGFNLPVGCLMRTPNGKYPEYHSSADDLNLVRPESLAGTLELCEDVFEILETNRRYLNTSPKGEPQLGKRGIYRKIGGPTPSTDLLTLLWILNFSDGTHTLLDIAARSSIPYKQVRQAADLLIEHRLLAVFEE
jgi:aminopeptidase-like protein